MLEPKLLVTRRDARAAAITGLPLGSTSDRSKSGWIGTLDVVGSAARGARTAASHIDYTSASADYFNECR